MNDMATARPLPGLDIDLLVTAHFVFAGKVGGAEHMLYNLLRGFASVGASTRVLCAAEDNLAPEMVLELRARRPDGLLACGGGAGSRFIAEQRACLRPGLDADVTLFPNYFVPPVVPRRLGRVAAVMHDMQFRHFPQNFAAKKRLWLGASQAFAMRRADRVIAISDFVRDDLLRHFGRRFERKVVTVPNPVSWTRFATGSKQRPIERPYILSVAAQYAHKNLDVLVEAFAKLAPASPDLMLVLCGQDYGGLRGVPAQEGGRLTRLVQERGLQDRVRFTGYLDDASLGDWYRYAAAFAFPSLFEGFGMPPVEALGFGIPTITSRCTALPEVTMGLASYVDDPARVDEWASRLLEMVRAPARFRPDEAAIGRLRHQYSPGQVARRYLEACIA